MSELEDILDAVIRNYNLKSHTGKFMGKAEAISLIQQLIDRAILSNQENLKSKLNTVYERYEKDKPPATFNRSEQTYNEGLLAGRLQASEVITQELFGIDGDQLTKDQERLAEGEK